MDFTAFNTALTALLDDVTALIAAETAYVSIVTSADQATIDAATASLVWIDQAVVGATPTPAPAEPAD